MLSFLDYWHIKKAIAVVKKSGIIAYPTESVFGLGCDPFNPAAVARLLAIKNRLPEKGLILIAASYQQIQPLITPISPAIQEQIYASWPGPVTWLLPASPAIPVEIRGKYASVAIRVTDHPIASALCRHFGRPIVSTSANFSDQPPVRTPAEVRQLFGNQLDYVISGKVGGLKNPTEIRDALTGTVIRKG